ncbi:pyridoxamine 5'-phosphate oxidase family protein [Lysobacter korlensis]|uniref:Pyridoxamine 5'-phosphate oxidase family protein n=1 Tax=Lysobacter korlensis TaxID=553636 RepID=A0ABV6RKZ1_9GAMM
MSHHDHTHADDREAGLKKLHDMIDDVEVAMLTGISADGRLLSRPLHTMDVDADGTLWFATAYDTEKVREIEANPQVNVSYESRGKGIYVSVSGRASIVRDRAIIDEKWSPGMSVFFKGGKDDPNLCLIRVDAESAEYWDGPSTAIGKGLYFLTTAVTRDPGNRMTENERIDLH